MNIPRLLRDSGMDEQRVSDIVALLECGVICHEDVFKMLKIPALQPMTCASVQSCTNTNSIGPMISYVNPPNPYSTAFGYMFSPTASEKDPDNRIRLNFGRQTIEIEYINSGWSWSVRSMNDNTVGNLRGISENRTTALRDCLQAIDRSLGRGNITFDQLKEGI